MTVIVGADHGGFDLKERLKEAISRAGHTVRDVSPRRIAGDDYPAVAVTASRALRRRRGSRAILVCRTGVGMAMVANRQRGIRAVQGLSLEVARRSRREEDANVLALAADYQPVPAAVRIARAWLLEPFRPRIRYRRRIRQFDHA